MVRRSESQVVLTGIPEGQVVALASPDQQNQNASNKGSAMKALTR
jgi:protein subunit release factor A